MIFSVRRPQYFISAHTKSQRLLETRHRLSCEKVNLHTRNVNLGRLCFHGNFWVNITCIFCLFPRPP